MVARGGSTFGRIHIKFICFLSAAILKLKNKAWHPYNPRVRTFVFADSVKIPKKRESYFQRSQRLPTPLLD
ncbi:hypothetical protein GDO78_003107 [Eleutherodactylus coqui]|uniref:Uncharacterized protein n=1 Tax=Eleutherodactylus coqui TaxID=57060 RepID=A0A8J6EX88_ELECQ|nr:hypothetical protein GDO78_003107 [Eleutherodactylus coqui]